MSSTTSVNNSMALVVYKAPEKTREEIQFERTKQAVLNKSMELHKKAAELDKSYLPRLPQDPLYHTFEYLTLQDAPAVAGTCKALQKAMGSHLVDKFNKAPDQFDYQEYEVFLKCGMRISRFELESIVWRSPEGVKPQLSEPVSAYLDRNRSLKKDNPTSSFSSDIEFVNPFRNVCAAPDLFTREPSPQTDPSVSGIFDE
jgi:hypothetical protein